MNASVSVILTAWQRPQLLEEQVERVLNQTIQPDEIILWYNSPPKRLGFFDRKQRVSFKNGNFSKSGGNACFTRDIAFCENLLQAEGRTLLLLTSVVFLFCYICHDRRYFQETASLPLYSRCL